MTNEDDQVAIYFRPIQVKFTPPPPGAAAGDRESPVAVADRHRTPRDHPDRDAEGHIAEVMTLQHGGRCERRCRVAAPIVWSAPNVSPID